MYVKIHNPYLVNDEKLEEDFEYSLSAVGDLGEQKGWEYWLLLTLIMMSTCCNSLWSA